MKDSLSESVYRMFREKTIATKLVFLNEIKNSMTKINETITKVNSVVSRASSLHHVAHSCLVCDIESEQNIYLQESGRIAERTAGSH